MLVRSRYHRAALLRYALYPHNRADRVDNARDNTVRESLSQQNPCRYMGIARAQYPRVQICLLPYRYLQTAFLFRGRYTLYANEYIL